MTIPAAKSICQNTSICWVHQMVSSSLIIHVNQIISLETQLILATPVEFCSGLHKYEFSFDLSPTLPSSFEGAFGYIRYLAKVAIDRPNTSILTTVEKFAIINAFDLNKDSPVLKVIQIKYQFHIMTFYLSICSFVQMLKPCTSQDASVAHQSHSS